MKYLLDTHVVLWVIASSHLLSQKARETIENSENTIYTSSISIWEISLKYKLGKLKISGFKPAQIPEFLETSKIEIIPLEADEASSYNSLVETHHKDPFDRMLIWQAIKRKLTIISKDSEMKRYKLQGLKTLW
ncbi:type II toxin-antitoxin system VapC family toxin [Leptospira yasudae]|uniref:type II toxin-antitoxin system VapC family toxin n=1 Tax=Leptospira yasudae TaxID=2202201 RepID=UPI0010834070|nr:type II toxin-antitoxin system VapC family toxin [Leptospira yasudae]TGK29740.1 type II toxin-antitoxin system VapC family toxin [Leptospira yasudae]TGM07635.1 type II toxin-antitoxin system VapC family toxin [Leptospira yasudae]